MIRPPNTERYFKHTLSLKFSLAGLIFLIVLPGGLFWEFHSSIDQGNLLPDRGDTSVPLVPTAAARVLSDTLLAPDARSKARVSKAYGQLPLSFELNQGQVDRQVRFTSRGSGYSLFLTATEAVLALRASAKTARTSSVDLAATHVEQAHLEVLRMKLVGANAAPNIKGVHEQPGKSNYFIGNDPQKWQTNVAHYAGVQYTGVYPGVDLVYYGNQRQLEYDFVVAPGTDPNIITLSFEGLKNQRINEDGDLILRTATGEVSQRKPFIYQEINGQRTEVAGRYRIKRDREIGFELTAYDTTKPLVIDPVLSYSSYLGGGGSDVGYDIAVDSSGNAYVTGATKSINFPVVNSLPSGDRDGGSEDVFITKLNAAGSALIYSTYLGGTSGNGEDRANAIAVDSFGNAYVAGRTSSTNFPTLNALQPTLRDFRDTFVTKLNSTGSAIVYSTYLGGSNSNEETRGIAVDSAGSAYVTGYTRSTDFPLVNALHTAFGGVDDGFVAKLNPGGSALVYSTYLGGNSYDNGNSIAVDSSGAAYITGLTYSNDFPLANPLKSNCGCFIGTCAGDGDAFITKLNPAGTALVYSTYLGGSSVEEGHDIAVDSSGNAYIAGQTASNDFPTVNPLQPTLGGGSAFCNSSDGFVTKLNPTGSALVYSTYLGGVNGDGASSIAVDSAGSAYVTGRTGASNFPIVNPSQPTIGGSEDSFITKLSPAGSGLIFSTYLGGSNSDVGEGITVDSAGNAYVTGSTSGNFPTEKPFQPIFGGGNFNTNERLDAFITKIGDTSLSPAAPSISAVTPDHGGNVGPVSITVHGSNFANGASVKLVRPGQTDIAAAVVTISDDGTVARARFDLTGQAPGVRNVLVVNPSGSSALREGAFTIEAGGAPQVWVDVVGRDTFRPGRPQTYYIYYSNRGNAEAYGTPLWITGIPLDATVELGFNIASAPQPAGYPPIDYSQVPIILRAATEKIIPLYLPVVRVGESTALKITLTIPTERDYQLRVSTQIAIFNPPEPVPGPGPQSGFRQAFNHAPRSRNFSKNKSTTISYPSNARNSAQPDGGISGGLGCLSSLGQTALNVADTISPLPISCGLSVALSFTDTIQFGYAAATNNTTGTVLSGVQTTVGMTSTLLDCAKAAGEGAVGIGRVVSGVQAALSLPQTISSCFGFGSSIATLGISSILSWDPNDKIGSRGSGTNRFIAGVEPLRYSIFFENKPEATAPAQDVVITDQLDASKLDLNTFSLGPIAFGPDKTVVPPPGLSEFKTDVDLRPANNLIVRVEAKLDKTSGLLTWRFTSLDPATGLPTEDPRGGFLPPNVIANEGEGQVLFTVRSKESLATGTAIRNKARIVFDTNAPIDTPEWLNTIDYSKPTSRVSSLAATQSSNNFVVGWSGSDTGSGVQSYTILVSENGGPFNVWQQDTTSTSGVFTGHTGTTYAFYSVARDRTGNQEDAPASADVTTRTLLSDTTAPVLTVPATITKEATGSGGAVVTYTASATDDRDVSPTISCTPSSGEMFPLGSTMITCTATDATGNRAQASFLVNVVDTRAPTITTPADIATNATSPAGATVSYTASATDIVDTTLTLTCSPASGSTFEIGQTVVTCTAVDDSGNRASRSFRVTVRGAADQLSDLVALVRSFNLHHGTENSLLAQLQGASDALTQGKTTVGCNSLNAFNNHVRAQDGKKISGVQASQLLLAANQISAVLGCR